MDHVLLLLRLVVLAGIPFVLRAPVRAVRVRAGREDSVSEVQLDGSDNHSRFTIVDLGLDSHCCQEDGDDGRGEDHFLVHHDCNEVTERLNADVDIAGYFISPSTAPAWDL